MDKQLNKNISRNLTTHICTNINQLNRIQQNSEFSLFHLNIQGLNESHFNELLVLLNERTKPFDIICLTETHLKRDSDEFNIPGYTTYFSNAKKTSFDGIAIYINQTNININEMKLLTFSEANSANLLFTYKSQSYSLTLIYRSPSGKVNNFLKELDLLHHNGTLME